MKVLLLPVNIASDISHKVQALKSLGIDARGLSITGSAIQCANNIRVFHLDKGNAITGPVRKITALVEIGQMISWADILHWVGDVHFFSREFIKRYLRRSNKPGVVQWTGSDIRIPEKDFPVNAYYERAYNEEGYECKVESSKASGANQAFFAELGFYPLEFTGMGRYINDQLFPKKFRTWQSVLLSEHPPKIPSTEKKRPLIVHSPSAPITKGTRYVLQAIEHLKDSCVFDFALVENMPRKEALKIMSECDVYIDQLILGAHGYAAVEAMAFGKPVVCYINQEIGKDYPSQLPIVNANPDNIGQILERLIRDGELRQEIGQRSRAYAEKYHDVNKIAHDLIHVYEEVIELHRRGRKPHS